MDSTATEAIREAIRSTWETDELGMVGDLVLVFEYVDRDGVIRLAKLLSSDVPIHRAVGMLDAASRSLAVYPPEWETDDDD